MFYSVITWIRAGRQEVYIRALVTGAWNQLKKTNWVRKATAHPERFKLINFILPAMLPDFKV